MALKHQVAQEELEQLDAEANEAARLVAEQASIVLVWDEREGRVPRVALGSLRELVATYEAKRKALLGKVDL